MYKEETRCRFEEYKTVLKNLKSKNKNMFRHIGRAHTFKIQCLAEFMAEEMVPDYTKLFGLWKGKGNKLDLNITRYINGKEWDAKFLEALVSERMKPFITKNCPIMQIGGMKGNSSSEHLIVVKT